MTDSVATWRTEAPWSVRVIERSPLEPAWTGLLVAGSIFSLYVALAAEFGWLDEGVPVWDVLTVRLEFLQSMMIGYLLAATAYSIRAAAGDLEALRPGLDCTAAEFEERLHGLARFNALSLGVSGFLSAAIGVSLVFSDQYWLGIRPPMTDPLMFWHLCRSLLLAWVVGRSALVIFFLGLRFSRIGRDLVQVDLLDPSALRVFTRHALRGVLVLMIYAGMMSLFFLAPYSASSNGVTILGVIVVAIAAFLGPILGIHARIAEARTAELERVRTAIRAASGESLDAGRPGALSDLIAYEQRIESVHTWPFDVGSILRFSLYLALGLGSWLGSALVERLLGTVLD